MLFSFRGIYIALITIAANNSFKIFGSMTDRGGKFCEPLSNGLCIKQLVFGPEAPAIFSGYSF
jgi:hypothetical protein